jgi:hypothetical protein
VSWRAPIDNEPKTEADVVREICAPRTYNQMWSMYLSERFGDDVLEDYGPLELN